MNPTSPAPDSKKFSLYPLLWLAIAFGFGIAAARVFDPEWLLMLGGCAVAASAALFLRRPFFVGLTLLLAFLFLGSFCYQFEIASVSKDRIRRIYDEGRITSGTPLEIEGDVVGRAEPAYDGIFMRLDAARLIVKGSERTATGKVRLFLPISDTEQIAELRSFDLSSGATIRTACELMREDQFLNPGVVPRRQLLDQQGIDATCTVKSALLIEVLGRSEWSSPFRFVYDARQWWIDEFRSRLSTSTAGVMAASLLGDKYFLDKETSDVFRDGGTFHVLVISGLHITFIGGILFWIVGRLTKNRLAQFLIVAGSLWLYTFAVGAEVPVVRASIMFTALMFSRAIYRTGTLLNTFGLCCLILLVWRPADLFDPSFQLTVVSVGAIVGMAFPVIEKLRSVGAWMPDSSSPFPPNVPTWLRRFCEALYWRQHVWEIEQGRQIWKARIFKHPYMVVSDFARTIVAYIFDGIVVSIIVQFWMLPLLVYYFHRVSPISIILNLWVGIVIALESFAAILAVLFGQISEALALPIAGIADLLNWLLVVLPRLFIYFDWSSFRAPVYSGAFRSIYLANFVPIVALAFLTYHWDPFALIKPRFGSVLRVAVSILIMAVAGIIAFHPYSEPQPDGRLHVEFLDVGQGDSAFITFPNGETMLIDAGGRVNHSVSDNDEEAFEPDVPRIGEMVVSEFLWEKGYSHVDHVMISHADADHAQGVADVLRNFSVGAVYIATVPDGDSELDEVLREAEHYTVPVREIGRGENFEIGGVRIETLWPVKAAAQAASDNNSSLVMRVIFGEHEFLFTGDIEQEAEEALLADGTLLNSDVLKVPHHGSRTSSTNPLIAAVAPKIAIVPVGRRSPFGHPHPEVVERLKRYGARVVTTGERGTVSFTSDGYTIEYQTFLK